MGPCERGRAGRATCCVIPALCSSGKGNTVETIKGSVVANMWVLNLGNMTVHICLNAQKVQSQD